MSVQVDLAERIKIIGARIREGRDTYAGRQDAWHLLGNVQGKFSKWREILDAAGQAFEVSKMQLNFMGVEVDAWGTFRIDTTIPKGLEKKAIRVEMADGAVKYLTFLGTVGAGYEVIQHTEAFELLDSLVGQIDGAHYETMGTLDFGRKVWAQVDPLMTLRVGDDVSTIYLTAHTSHDGSSALEVFENAIREVCRNTYRLGSLRRLGQTLRVRHTKNADKRITDFKAELAEIRSVALSMQEKLVWLSQRQVKKENLTTIMNRLFPPTKNDDGVEVSSTRRDNVLAEILSLYEDNDNNTFPEQRGTPYCLFNSITNFADYSRSSKGDGRAEAAVFGSGDRLKTNALDIIMAEAEHMPLMPTRGASVEVNWEEVGISLPKRAN
jgi:phage/plasmid-like protein (TIGR03299 family)